MNIFNQGFVAVKMTQYLVQYILVYHGLSWSILGYLGLSRFISGYLRVSRDISGYLLLSWPVSAYLSLFWGIPGLYPVKYAILGYLWLSLAISGYLGLSLAILGGLCQVSSIRVPEDAGERKLLQFKLFCYFFFLLPTGVIEELALLKRNKWQVSIQTMYNIRGKEVKFY